MTESNSPPAGDTAAPAPGAATGTDHMIPKARLDEEIGKRKAVEADFAAVCDALLAEIPDHLKPLIPDALGPAAKVKWYQNAKATGVFSGTVKVPETDTGKPKTTPRDRDLSTLPAHARIAAGYQKA